MNQQNQQAAGGGISIAGLLGVAFIILKLVGVIDWSWWWVLAPFWGPIALVVAIILVVLIVWAIVKGVKAINREHRYRHQRKLRAQKAAQQK